MTSPASPVSELLRSCGRGDLQARDRLLPLVYRDLKQRAAAPPFDGNGTAIRSSPPRSFTRRT